MTKTYIENIEKVGLFSLIILGIGGLTGAGIYSLLGPTGQIAGPATIISLLIGSIFALIVSSFYSELVSVNPINGGGFVYVKEAYGEKALYLGWLTWLANMSYGALVAHTTSSFIISLFGLEEYLIRPIAIAFVVIMALVNIRGAKFLSKIQIPLTTALVASLIIGSVYLFLNPNPSINWNLNSFFPYGILPIIPAAALLFVVFIGFEDICTIAEEVKKPRKNIPKAYYIILVTATLIYLMVIISLYVSTELGTIQQSEIAFLDAVSDNRVIFFIVYIGAIFSLLTTLGISLMAQSRNLVALSINDFTDRKYAEIDKKADAPIKAIKLSSIICILILLSGQVEFYASITVVAYMFIVNSLALSVFKFRKKKNYPQNTFRVPLHPYSTIFAMVLSGLLIITLDPSIIFVPLIWLLIGLILYLFFSSKRRIYGTIFLITAFFFALTDLFIGLLILAIGFIYYLVKISDRSSKRLTLTGLKFFFTVIIGGFILILKYYSQINSILPISNNFIIHILLFVCILSMVTVFFDLISVKEVFYYFLKKNQKDEAIIQINDGKIIVFEDKYKKCIFIINEILAIIQLFFFTLIVIFFILFSIEIITIGELIIGNISVSQENTTFLFSLILIIFGVILGMNGGLSLYINYESKHIDV